MDEREVLLEIEKQIKVTIDSKWLDIPTTPEVISNIYEDVEAIVAQYRWHPAYNKCVVIIMPSLEAIVCTLDEAKKVFQVTEEDFNNGHFGNGQFGGGFDY